MQQYIFTISIIEKASEMKLIDPLQEAPIVPLLYM